jgi:hypothetical protein
MEDKKDIIIPSLRFFYDVLQNNEEIIFKDSTLAVIKDYLDAAYHGCSCKKKENEDKALHFYKILNEKVNREVILELKNVLQANKILFFHENNLLFDL